MHSVSILLQILYAFNKYDLNYVTQKGRITEASLLQLVQALLGRHHRLATSCLYLTFLLLSRKHLFTS